MNLKKVFFVIGVYVFILISSCGRKAQRLNIVPLPTIMEIKKGEFHFSNNTEFIFDESNEKLNFIVSKLKELTDYGYKDGQKNYIIFKLVQDTSLGKEGYELLITGDTVLAKANTEHGIFYSYITLKQILLDKSINDNKKGILPAVYIKDKPIFGWRGFELDCGRHFFSVETIKKYLDYLAFYKLNTFHWHLTEDQGWRIEIKKYPELTKIGAYRHETPDSIYGGYYTQEQIKEVVKYAEERFINVVPEIEMPGHCSAALATFPELSCRGERIEVPSGFGVFADVYCAGNEKTFKFLEDVLSEVIELFPSKYIHIGGDEVPKNRWKECPKCQMRIKKEHLKNEEELQSYFIKRIEKFLNSHGKTIIGWDEILEGGVAPSAVVQSWRGYEGGIEAANQDHFVIMSPNSYVYFNSSVKGINLRKAYSFDPIPQELDSSKVNFILGSECCLWSEYIPDEKRLDYQAFPRLLAFSEVLWSNKKDYENFKSRLEKQYNILDYFKVNYGPESEDINYKLSFIPDKKVVNVSLFDLNPELKYFYVIGNDTMQYSKPFEVDKGNEILIFTKRNGKLYGEYKKIVLNFHKLLGEKVSFVNAPNEKYIGLGDYNLTDGIRASTNFYDGLWSGVKEKDLIAVLDLKKEIKHIGIGMLQNVNSWIFFPSKLELYISENGKSYIKYDVIVPDVSKKDTKVQKKDFIFPKELPSNIRSIKIIAYNIGKCPPWHRGAGGQAWIFADEILGL